MTLQNTYLVLGILAYALVLLVTGRCLVGWRKTRPERFAKIEKRCRALVCYRPFQASIVLCYFAPLVTASLGGWAVAIGMCLFAALSIPVVMRWVVLYYFDARRNMANRSVFGKHGVPVVQSIPAGINEASLGKAKPASQSKSEF